MNTLDGLTTISPEEKLAITEFAGLLRQKFPALIKEIILFGSKVRGNSEENSDIDILIVIDSLTWETKKTISELAANENINHNVLISTVRYDSETWEDPVVKASPFGMSVRKEGVWL